MAHWIPLVQDGGWIPGVDWVLQQQLKPRPIARMAARAYIHMDQLIQLARGPNLPSPGQRTTPTLDKIAPSPG